MTDAKGAAEANPLRQNLPRARVPEPCAVVLFGATGDLTHRKLVPALYHLAQGGNLPGEFAIVGFARRDWTDAQLRDELAASLKKDGGPEFERLWPDFASHIAFTPGTLPRCRSPWPRRWGWPAAGARITTPRAPSATWSRTT